MSGIVDLPFSDREKLMIVTQLDAYVTGAVRQQILYEAAVAESGITDEEFWEFQMPWVERAMESGDYPMMAGLDEDSFEGGWEESFELGLSFLLAGVERLVATRGGTT